MTAKMMKLVAGAAVAAAAMTNTNDARLGRNTLKALVRSLMNEE